MFKIKLWWRAFRPISYPASVVPALLGIVLAWQAGFPIRIDLAIVTVSGALAIHTATNLLQDYFDFENGVDRPGTLGGSGVLVEGRIRPREIFFAAVLFFAISAAAAVPLILHAGMPLVVLIAAGFVAGAGYAVPNFGFKYRALGDVAVFFAFGIGITLGSYIVQARSVSWTVVICAASFGLLVDGILHANNMRDMEDDLRIGVRTLSAILGERGSRVFFLCIIAGAYAVTLVSAAVGVIHIGALLSLVTLPLAIGLMRDVWRTTSASREVLALAVGRTAMLSLVFGITMMMGIVGWQLFV